MSSTPNANGLRHACSWCNKVAPVRGNYTMILSWVPTLVTGGDAKLDASALSITLSAHLAPAVIPVPDLRGHESGSQPYQRAIQLAEESLQGRPAGCPPVKEAQGVQPLSRLPRPAAR